MDGIDQFDAEFFGYSPQEAELMDPQQRLFLETAHEALERSGHDPARPPGPVGVYCGAGFPIHMAYLLHVLGPSALLDLQVILGNDKDQLATRVSYKLGLQGPSVTVQTACSTSMTAVHMACQALLTGECDMAIAGGIALRIPPAQGYLFQTEGIVSPDGHCRPFDANAQGTVPGSGVGVVVLRRLQEAIQDGDPVRAVIRGTALNNDGGAKVGFTAPSELGQANVIAEAIRVAEVDPCSIAYVETHGTGTPLGDPVEVAALKRGYGAGPDAPLTCFLGSVKSNIGHPDAASGIAGLIKTVLMLEHGFIPPTLHFRQANPRLGLEEAGLRVNAAGEPWPSVKGPRRAGVSSFGMGGTNVHAILQEAPSRVLLPPSGRPQLLVLSARTPEALAKYRNRLADWMEAREEPRLEDVAFTLMSGRRRFPLRWSAVVTDLRSAIRALREGEPGREEGTGTTLPFLREASRRWQRGEDLEIGTLVSAPCRRIELPTYPFQRKTHWAGPKAPVPPLPWGGAQRKEQSEGHPAPDDLLPVDGTRSATETAICRIWTEVLGADPIGLDDVFYHLGGDSLRAIEVKTRLEEAFPVEVGLQAILQTGSPRALAAHVDHLLLQKVTALTDEEVHRMLPSRGGLPTPLTHS